MREADRQIISKGSLEKYLELSSVMQTSFLAGSDGNIFRFEQHAIPDLTHISEFEKSGVTTNQEIRELLARSAKFLESPRGLSEITHVEYINSRNKTQMAQCTKELRSISYISTPDEWKILVWKPDERKKEAKQAAIFFAVCHEVGHIFLQDHVPTDLVNYWITMYEQHVPFWEMPYSDSSTYNAREDFADAIAELILKPDSIIGWRKKAINTVTNYTFKPHVSS